jgi:cytoskeletal protein CcmA (bactofilin family)
MWKSRPEESSPGSPTQRPLPAAGTPVSGMGSEPAQLLRTQIQPFREEVATHIGKSVMVKGELSGDEDLYLDGEVEGTIELRSHRLIVGPNGRIRASINAKEVVLHGQVVGSIIGTERVELKKSCVLAGDINTHRIVIEEGASLKGSVDLGGESRSEVSQAEAQMSVGSVARHGA